MITLPTLLEDPKFKEYFCKVPKLPYAATRLPQPWEVQMRLKGKKGWTIEKLDTYKGAFLLVNGYRKEGNLVDGAIVCKRIQFPPPMRVVRIKGKYKIVNGVRSQETRLVAWKPTLDIGEPDHHWCGYCRRPTVFGYYRTHHALPKTALGKGVELDPSILRCAICGASERIVSLK